MHENSVWALWTIFSEQIIRRELWSLCSLDMDVCDFHLLGNLELKVYRNNPHIFVKIQMVNFNVCHRICYNNVKCAGMLEDTTFSSYCNIRYVKRF